MMVGVSSTLGLERFQAIETSLMMNHRTNCATSSEWCININPADFSKKGLHASYMISSQFKFRILTRPILIYSITQCVIDQAVKPFTKLFGGLLERLLNLLKKANKLLLSREHSGYLKHFLDWTLAIQVLKSVRPILIDSISESWKDHAVKPLSRLFWRHVGGTSSFKFDYRKV